MNAPIRREYSREFRPELLLPLEDFGPNRLVALVISYTDNELGRVLGYLEDSEQLDTTLIVVSDNGGSGEGGPNGSFNEWRFVNGIADSTDVTMPHIDELGTRISRCRAASEPPAAPRRSGYDTWILVLGLPPN